MISIVDVREIQPIDFVRRQEGREVRAISVEIDAQPGSTVWARADGGDRREVTTDARGSSSFLLWVPDASQTVERRIECGSDGDTTSIDLLVPPADRNWTIFLVPHFHYDPVWWNTQSNFVEEWEAHSTAQSMRGMESQTDAFSLMKLHLDKIERDSAYKFVISEIDYLHPWWSRHPEAREQLLTHIRNGRIEVVGGSYNEPSSTLVSAEAVTRNMEEGIRFHRDTLGATPNVSWQLDVFGHDPHYPAACASNGVRRATFARGPFHEWGPLHAFGGVPRRSDPRKSFDAEFEWMSPNGDSVLMSYMTSHYSSGWWMDGSGSASEAMDELGRLFGAHQRASATANVLIPVGTDHTRPNRWITQVARDWADEVIAPALRIAVPSEYFDVVEEAVNAGDAVLTTQTRDMNPVFAGTAVSYADTKQAQRAIEFDLLEAEAAATLAWAEGIAPLPRDLLADAWRAVSFASHHDAITGSESDQVYIDLLATWRRAWQSARTARDAAEKAIADQIEGAVDGSTKIAVFNWLSPRTSGLTRVTLDEPPRELLSADGASVPFAATETSKGWLMEYRAEAPTNGYATYTVRSADTDGEAPGWRVVDGNILDNGILGVTLDPRRGGCIVSIVDRRDGTEHVEAGAAANELIWFAEYDDHPVFGELGPWYIMPTGDVIARSSEETAAIEVERSDLGIRATVRYTLGGRPVTQTILLLDGEDMVRCTTDLHGHDHDDALLRISWPTPRGGRIPVAQTAIAAIGRNFADIRTDTAIAPWRLDGTCHEWFGLAAPMLVSGSGEAGDTIEYAVGIAEIVSPHSALSASAGRDIALALVRNGVTSTNTLESDRRYGDLEEDSNLPDLRILLVGSESGPILEDLSRIRPELTDALLLAEKDGEVLLLPPAPDETLPSEVRGLPLLIVPNAPSARERLRDGIGKRRIDARMLDDGAALGASPRRVSRGSTTLLNRGTPGYAVEPDGTLHLSALRSSSGWPSGVWLDGDRPTVPDGSAFQLQHWPHRFDYALVVTPEDWRARDLTAEGLAFNHGLRSRICDAVGSAGARDTATLLTQEYSQADNVVFSSIRPSADHSPEVLVTLRESRGEVGEVVVELRGASEKTTVPPHDLVTLRLPIDPTSAAADTARQTPARFASYWLQNDGPFDAGTESVGVILRLSDADDRLDLRIFSTDDEALAGTVRVTVVTPGASADVVEEPLREVREWRTAIEIPLEGAVSVRAEFRDSRGALYDAFVRGAGLDDVRLAWERPRIELGVGEVGTARLSAVSHARLPLDAHVSLLGPWGTWEWCEDWDRAIPLNPDAENDIDFPLEVPAGTPAGRYWMLARVTVGSDRAYTESFAIDVVE